MRATYNLNPTLGNKEISRDFYLNARFSNSGAFKECYSAQKSLIDGLQSEFCKTLNQDLKNTSGVLAKWDDVAQKCVTQNNNVTCASGEAIEGIKPDGSVSCRKLTEGFVGKTGSAPTTNCLSNQISKSVYNSVTKAFDIICENLPGTTPTPAPTQVTCQAQSPATWNTNCQASLAVANSGASVTLTNTASSYTGSATYLCSSTGVWQLQSGQTCSPVVITCPSQSPITWSTNCQASLASANSGASSTIANTKSRYTGSATYLCSSSGSWQPQGTPTCSASAAPTTGSCSGTGEDDLR